MSRSIPRPRPRRAGACCAASLVAGLVAGPGVVPTASAQIPAAPAAAVPDEPEPPPAAVRTEPPPAPVPAPALRQKERGLVLFSSFTARLFMIAADGSNTPSQTALQGGVFGGYKLNRLIVGLGFDLSSFDITVKFKDGGNSTSSVISNTGFLFSPGAQLALISSADRRTELIGLGQIGLGSIFSRTYQDPELPIELRPENNERTFYLTYRVGPGLRFWAQPQLALSLITGVAGDYLFTFLDNPSGNRTDQRGSTAFFINLGALGVF